MMLCYILCCTPSYKDLLVTSYICNICNLLDHQADRHIKLIIVKSKLMMNLSQDDSHLGSCTILGMPYIKQSGGGGSPISAIMKWDGPFYYHYSWTCCKDHLYRAKSSQQVTPFSIPKLVHICLLYLLRKNTCLKKNMLCLSQRWSL